MKSKVFKMMWELIKKANLNKSEALKKAWETVKEISKKEYKSFEEAEEFFYDRNNKRMRSNFETKVVYYGKAKTEEYCGKGSFSTSDWKIWAKFGKIRLYFNKKLDGVVIENNYITIK